MQHTSGETLWRMCFCVIDTEIPQVFSVQTTSVLWHADRNFTLLVTALKIKFEVKRSEHIGFSLEVEKEHVVLNRTIRIDVAKDEATL